MKKKAAIIVAVLAAISIIRSWNYNDPRFFPLFVGKYERCDRSDGESLKITPDKRISYVKQSDGVSVSSDKISLLLVPDHMISVAEDRSIVFSTASPLVLRVDSDGLGFTVPGRATCNAHFRKDSCVSSAAGSLPKEDQACIFTSN